MAMFDWTDGKFGVDFDEYGPLPASLDDPRRRHGTYAATFTEWLLVCGLAAVSPMAMDDPCVKVIHHLRALPFHFGKPGWEARGWRWNGRAEVESEYPSCARAFWHPEPVSLDQRIGGFKELSHDCDDGDFGGFPGLAERGVFSLEVGVETHGNQGWHVEGIAQRFAPAAE